MALTDIVASINQYVQIEEARGNIGTLTDIINRAYNQEQIPLVTGGGGGEVSVIF